MITELILEFPETYNTKTFKVVDLSYYNPNLKIECATLEIIPPGFEVPAVYDLQSNFSLIVNSGNLGISKFVKADKLPALQDGIYKLKYSIKPNDRIWVEYNYFRNQLQLKKYGEEITKLFSKRDFYNQDEFLTRKKELIWVKELIDASKYYIEDLGEKEKGLKLYDEANEILNKLSNCISC